MLGRAAVAGSVKADWEATGRAAKQAGVQVEEREPAREFLARWAEQYKTKGSLCDATVVLSAVSKKRGEVRVGCDRMPCAHNLRELYHLRHVGD